MSFFKPCLLRKEKKVREFQDLKFYSVLELICLRKAVKDGIKK